MNRTLKLILDSDVVLLAVLLQCLHEAHNFSGTNRLLPHLNAAATLLWRRLQQPPRNTELLDFLLALFCYFFALTIVTHGSIMANDPATQVFASVLVKYQQHETGADKRPLLGKLDPLLWTIFRVSTLALQASADPIVDSISRSQLKNLESQLECWKKENLGYETTQTTSEFEGEHDCLEMSQPPQPCTSSNSDDSGYDDRIVFELYRLACLVYVKRTVDPHASLRHPYIQRVIASFIKVLHSLPMNSFANGILGWPLVTVGLCSVVGSHQRIIIARLRSIHNTWRSDIFTQNIEFLRGHWVKLRSYDQPEYDMREEEANDPIHEPSNSSHFTFQTVGLPTVLV